MPLVALPLAQLFRASLRRSRPNRSACAPPSPALSIYWVICDSFTTGKSEQHSSFGSGRSHPRRLTLHDWRNSFLGVFFGALAGIVLGLGGFYLTRIESTHAMGPVIFILVPFAAGFVITLVSRGIERVSAAAVLASLTVLSFMILTRMESLLCVVLVLPVFFCAIMCGVTVGYVFLKFIARRDPRNPLFMPAVILSMPLLILVGHRVELKTLVHPRQEIVTTTIHLAADPA